MFLVRDSHRRFAIGQYPFWRGDRTGHSAHGARQWPRAAFVGLSFQKIVTVFTNIPSTVGAMSLRLSVGQLRPSKFN
jgi:hypothetical protein